MEEFGLGNLEVIKALSPFPGFGGTGWMCGGVTGGLIALGLYFGSEDLEDSESVRKTILAAREFMQRFEQQAGAVTCPKLHEDVVFGRYMDPAAQRIWRFCPGEWICEMRCIPGARSNCCRNY
jgi:C_GCAxxG_C_C family probable redox protein